MGLGGAACTRTIDPAEEKKLSQFHELVMELERKYSRDFSKEGYSLEFGSRPPYTVVVSVAYFKNSPQETTAINVLNASKTFVTSLAEQKYGLASIEDITIFFLDLVTNVIQDFY